MKLTLTVLDGTYAVCRLDAAAEMPAWALGGGLVSITRTPEELCVVCEAEHAPLGAQCDEGWRCLKVHGPFDFDVSGVLSSLTAPLAAARIGVFAISTYDTDYLLVKEGNLQRAIEALSREKHHVSPL